MNHERLLRCASDDVEWEQSSSPPLPRGYKGVAVVIEQLDRAFPDFTFAQTEAAYASSELAQSDRPWRFTGIMTGPLKPPGLAPIGARVEFEGDDHWDFGARW